jgi:anti-sigma B factor antagonist
MTQKTSIIPLSGVFDGTQAVPFRDNIRQDLEAGVDVILLDCQELGFMDSSGLGAMISGLKMVRAAGKTLCLCAVNKQVGMLLDLTDTRRVFKIFPDRHAFEQAAWGDAAV